MVEFPIFPIRRRFHSETLQKNIRKDMDGCICMHACWLLTSIIAVFDSAVGLFSWISPLQCCQECINYIGESLTVAQAFNRRIRENNLLLTDCSLVA